MDVLITQITKFVSVGIINTLVDIGFFNLFRRIKGFTATTASYVSTTIAMIGSYFLNKSWTFASNGNSATEAVKFFATTILGIYIIHNGIVYLLTKKVLWPGKLALKIVRIFPFLNKLSDSFITDNFAKVCAIAITLVYNFIVYKFLVFVK
jgi:putative flippase GtrA